MIKKIIIILGVILAVAVSYFWFLLWGNSWLGGLLYQTKFGYLLDINQIKDSCADEIILYLYSDTDPKTEKWTKKYDLAPYIKTETGRVLVKLKIVGDWKGAMKEAREGNLITSYLIPPIPFNCNR